MKNFSKFLAIVMALCMCLGTSVTNVFAAEATSDDNNQSVVLSPERTKGAFSNRKGRV